MKIEFIKTDTIETYPIGLEVQLVKEQINKTVEALLLKVPKDEFIAFWCTGSSGLIISTLLSQYFCNSVINHVKKHGENSHSGNSFNIRKKFNLVVDDFSSTGNTINGIVTELILRNINFDGLILLGGVDLIDLHILPNFIIANKILCSDMSYKQSEIINYETVQL